MLVTLIHTIRTASFVLLILTPSLVLLERKKTCHMSFTLILWVLKIHCGVRVNFILKVALLILIRVNFLRVYLLHCELKGIYHFIFDQYSRNIIQ